MSHYSRTNAYRSSNSVIVCGPGTMYNEITRPKSNTKQYHENTNTYSVTVPYMHTAKVRKNNTKSSKNTNK